MNKERDRVIRESVKEILEKLELTGSVEILVGGEKAQITRVGEKVEICGNEILIAECLRIIKKLNSLTLNKINAGNYLRSERVKAGKESHTKE